MLPGSKIKRSFFKLISKSDSYVLKVNIQIPMKCLITLLFLIFMTSKGSEATQPLLEEKKRYPQEALQCYATLAAPPKHKIICPEDRNNYCIKEVTSSTSRRECGSTSEYPDDVWDHRSGDYGECVYRKCASSCPNSTRFFEGRDGELVERRAECCKSQFCNSGFMTGAALIWLTLTSIVTIFIL